MTNEDYLDLIPQQNKNKPKFEATILAFVSICTYAQDLMQEVEELFDLDNAKGEQQDILAEWIGTDRRIPVPIEDHYFEWDDNINPTLTGWDFGQWQGIGDPDDGLESLSDEAFTGVLKSKALSNRWMGDLPSLFEIFWQVFTFQTLNMVITDNQNMTMNVETVGFSDFDRNLLDQNIIFVKPACVGLTYTHTDPNLIGIAVEVDITTLAGWNASTIDTIKGAVFDRINKLNPKVNVKWKNIKDVAQLSSLPEGDTFTSDAVRLAITGDALLEQDIIIGFYQKAINLIVNISVTIL
jgi:hypothetical protein